MPRPSEIAADARALYGPVASRPAAADMGDGALWVDPGAGHALYQVQSGNWVTISPGEAGGTVSSVGLSTSGLLHSVSGSPVTGSGTLSLDLKTQLRNTVLAGPGSGADAVPTMRALVAADIPSLDAAALGSGTLALARLSGLTTTQLSASAGLLAGQLAVSSPTSGQIGGLTMANLSSSAGLVAGQIASVNPSALTGSGTVPLAALAGITQAQLSASAAITSGQIASVAASTLTGSHTLPDGTLSTNVPLLNGSNTFASTTKFTGTLNESTSDLALYLGVAGSTPRIIFSGSGTLREIDGSSGVLRFFHSGSTDMQLDTNANLMVGNRIGVGNLGTPSYTLHVASTASGSTGQTTVMAVAPNVNQSGTAGYTALLINPTETATGSGSKLLLDLQVGGSSRASIDDTGAFAFSPATTTTAPSAGAGNALPATPAGYATVTLNGVQRSIAYY